MAAIGTSISPQAIEATIIPIGKMPVTMKEAPTSSQPMAHSEPGDNGRSRSCPETRSYHRIDPNQNDSEQERDDGERCGLPGAELAHSVFRVEGSPLLTENELVQEITRRC